MKTKQKPALRVLASALVVILSLALLQRLLMPKYVDGIVEGAFVAEYYREVKDHDLLFVGDCEVYENFSRRCCGRTSGSTAIFGEALSNIFFSPITFWRTLFTMKNPR